MVFFAGSSSVVANAECLNTDADFGWQLADSQGLKNLLFTSIQLSNICTTGSSSSSGKSHCSISRCTCNSSLAPVADAWLLWGAALPAPGLTASSLSPLHLHSLSFNVVARGAPSLMPAPVNSSWVRRWELAWTRESMDSLPTARLCGGARAQGAPWLLAPEAGDSHG